MGLASEFIPPPLNKCRPERTICTAAVRFWWTRLFCLEISLTTRDNAHALALARDAADAVRSQRFNTLDSFSNALARARPIASSHWDSTAGITIKLSPLFLSLSLSLSLVRSDSLRVSQAC